MLTLVIVWFKMDGLIIGWFGGKPTFFGNIHLWFSINLEARSLNLKGIFYPALEIPHFFQREKNSTEFVRGTVAFPGSGSTFFTPKKTGPLTFGGSKKKTNQPLSSWWLNHPVEKYACQIGSFPQIGVKIMFFWNHHLGLVMLTTHPSESSTHPFSTQVCLFSKEKISRIKLEFIEVSSFWRFFWVHWTETSQNFVYLPLLEQQS